MMHEHADSWLLLPARCTHRSGFRPLFCLRCFRTTARLLCVWLLGACAKRVVVATQLELHPQPQLTWVCMNLNVRRTAHSRRVNSSSRAS